MFSDPKGEWSSHRCGRKQCPRRQTEDIPKRLSFKVGGGKREGMCKFSVHELNEAIRTKQTDANGKREQDNLHELFGLYIICIVSF